MSWTFVKSFLEIRTCDVHWIPFLSPMVVLSSKKPNQMVKLAFPFLGAISLCSRWVFLSVFPVLISEKDFVRHFLRVKFNKILRYVPTLLLIHGSITTTWTYRASTKTSCYSNTHRSFPTALVIHLSSPWVNNNDFHLTPKIPEVYELLSWFCSHLLQQIEDKRVLSQTENFKHHRNHRWDEIFVVQSKIK